MSATGRGGVRMKGDWYRTPAWPLLRLLECPDFALPRYRGARYLEAGAGDGILIRAFNAWHEERRLPIPDWTAVELDEQHLDILKSTSARVIHADYLCRLEQLHPRLRERRFDVSLGNPPFDLSDPFVRRDRELAREVIRLLPLDFLSSAERQPMMELDAPNVYVLPQRPTFIRVHNIDETGKATKTSSDAQTYGWFHWPADPQPIGKMRVLRLTDADVVSAARMAAPQVWIERGEIVRVEIGNPFYIGR